MKIIRVDPERHNAEISKELGRRWRELSASEKRPFYERSKHLNELHKIEFPDYKYRPRKKRDHSLKLSTAPDGLAVINVSESSSEANNNNNNNNNNSSSNNNIHNINNNSNNGVDKNSKKSLKKLNCRGRTRMFSSSMLVQRTLESTKSSELMENAVLTSSHAAALYNGGDFAAHKTSEHLTEYTEDHNHPHLEIHNPGVMGIGMTSPTAGDECLMRSRSAEQLQDNYFRSIESNHWMNYDTNNHFSNNYFPLYRSYQDDHHNHHQQQQQQQQQLFYNNSIRENFMDDPSYPVRAEYLVSSNMINQQQQQLIYTSWAQDVQNYAGDENLGGKNPATFNNNGNNNSFYHPTTAVNNEALYADVSHPIKSGFYTHSEPLPIEMWHDYPISQTTDYHRSYSVSSASSTSRSPTSTHPPHPAEEAMYLTIDQSAKTQTSEFELKNSSLTSSSGTNNQLNSRHPAFYNPIFAFAAHDLSLNYLES